MVSPTSRTNRHVLLTGHSVPGEGAGTSVVLHRHVRRLRRAGWRVTVALPSHVDRCDQADDVVALPFRRPGWPPHREGVPGSGRLRATLLGRHLARQVVKNRPDVVLTVMEPHYSAVAVAAAERLGCPCAAIIHDQMEVCWADRLREPARSARLRAEAVRTLSRVQRVYPVTSVLASEYGPKVTARSLSLLPIPEGSVAPAASWRSAYSRPHVVLTGSLHPFQRPNVAALAPALAAVGGALTLVSHHDLSPFRDLADAHPNLSLRGAFETPAEAADYCRAEASAVLVSYAFCATDQPWTRTSFPSKLVEFVHLGLPVLVLAPAEAAVSAWARDERWASHVDTLHSDALANEVRALSTPEGWGRRAADAARVSRGAFCPDRIHARLQDDLAALAA